MKQAISGYWCLDKNGRQHYYYEVSLFNAGAKLLAYGDSLRTGVETGLLHNSNVIFHFCLKHLRTDRLTIFM